MQTEDNKLSVFVTNLCNLHCKHCFVRGTPVSQQQLSWQQIKNVLDFFSHKNFKKVDFTGGEACLSPFICPAVNYARQLGFSHISLSTNGTQDQIFTWFTPQKINRLRFSLDGPNADIHDTIRGKYVFKKCLNNIKRAIFLGFEVETIFTVNQINLDYITETIKLLNKLKIVQISFNFTSAMGNAINFPEIIITPQQWIEARKLIESVSSKTKIPLRYPLRFADQKTYQSISQQHHCLIPKSNRIFVMPDGLIFRCCLITDQPHLAWAKVNNHRVAIINNHELNFLSKQSASPCPAEHKIFQASNGQIIPLCIFFKQFSHQ